MPELRKDPLIERWVVMAPERANRPIELLDQPTAAGNDFDPFAEGNEEQTPGEILAYRDQTAVDGPGWRVRVVPNKYPALVRDGDPNVRTDGLYVARDAVGAHEVIVECPHDEANLSHLDVAAVRDVLMTYRERLIDLKRDPRLVHALIFKNKGAAAGASLRHAHSQLIATSVVPINIWEEMTGALQYYNVHGRSIFEDLIQQERQVGSRIVIESPRFIACCPYASRFAYETWIIPKQSGSHFEEIPESQLEELGQMLKSVLHRLEVALDDPPYNYVLHTAPFNQPALPHYSWHFEIFPRISRVAGYEWGSGFYINTILPEEAARQLRDVAV